MGLQAEDMLTVYDALWRRQDFRKEDLHMSFRGWEHKDVSLHNSEYSEVASGIFWDLYSA